MHHPTTRTIHTIAFVMPVVEHWLKCGNANGFGNWDRSDNPQDTTTELRSAF